MNPHCTRKVIGGELQERLIPVPYSKTSTDQAVRFETKPALSLTFRLFGLFFFVTSLFFRFPFTVLYTYNFLYIP